MTKKGERAGHSAEPPPFCPDKFNVTYQVGRAPLLSRLGSPGDQRASVTTARNGWLHTSGGGAKQKRLWQRGKQQRRGECRRRRCRLSEAAFPRGSCDLCEVCMCASGCRRVLRGGCAGCSLGFCTVLRALLFLNLRNQANCFLLLAPTLRIQTTRDCFSGVPGHFLCPRFWLVRFLFRAPFGGACAGTHFA